MKNILKSKKVVMITAMILMVALVVGMGAMTYSRYVTSNSMDQAATATVAKWGYVVNVNANDMFAETYESKDSGKDKLAIAAAGDDVVRVTSAGAIVAPGTTGSMTINYNGQAEVLAELVIDVAAGYSDVALVLKDGSTYNPVKWTLSDSSSTLVNKGTLAELVAELETNTTLTASTSVNETYTITWEWALDGTETNANLYDTILGYMANNESATLTSAQLQGLNIDDLADVIDTDATHIYDISFQLDASIQQIQSAD